MGKEKGRERVGVASGGYRRACRRRRRRGAHQTHKRRTRTHLPARRFFRACWSSAPALAGAWQLGSVVGKCCLGGGGRCAVLSEQAAQHAQHRRRRRRALPSTHTHRLLATTGAGAAAASAEAGDVIAPGARRRSGRRERRTKRTGKVTRSLRSTRSSARSDRKRRGGSKRSEDGAVNRMGCASRPLHTQRSSAPL